MGVPLRYRVRDVARSAISAKARRLVTDEELAALESAARDATPGPWKWWTSNSRKRLTGDDRRDGGVIDAISLRDGADVVVSVENAAYLAAVSPDVVLRLIERIRELDRSETELIEERDARCAQIDAIADQLGDDSEWTNLNDRGDAALNAAHCTVLEVERLRGCIARCHAENGSHEGELEGGHVRMPDPDPKPANSPEHLAEVEESNRGG